MFAISAASANADENFKKVKEVIKAIIDTYSMNKLRYGVIVFGSSATTRIALLDDFPSDKKLKSFLNIISRERELPDLDKALKMGKELFYETPERPNARRVLVVILDRKSTSKLPQLRESAKMLEEDSIRVIAVAIGNEVDRNELGVITPDKTHVINVTTDVTVIDFKEKIIRKVFEGKSTYRDVIKVKYLHCLSFLFHTRWTVRKIERDSIPVKWNEVLKREFLADRLRFFSTLS